MRVRKRERERERERERVRVRKRERLLLQLNIKLKLIILITLQQQQKTDLEVYDHSKDEDCGDEVQEIGQVLSVEGLSQCSHFISTSGQQVEQSNNSSLKLSTCTHTNKIQSTSLSSNYGSNGDAVS